MQCSACEAAIGACLGLGVLVLLHGMTLAGELIAQASGLGIAEMFDPTIEENISLFSRLMFLAAVTVFLCIGGHRMVMAGLLDTFQTIPPGSGELPASLADGFTTLVAMSFSLGVRVAAPVVTALLLATLILGLIGRTLPQLNILALGFGLNSLLAFAALGTDVRRRRLGVSGSNPARDASDFRRTENAAEDGMDVVRRGIRDRDQTETGVDVLPIPHP